jgi:SAM-dependent methyltransferase
MALWGDNKLNNKIISSYYPEFNISGYTSVDGTVEFYSRVNSLVDTSMSVLDFGAGRAAWYEDDCCNYRKTLRYIKGKVKNVVGCDVDDAIYENRSVDEKVVIKVGDPLPFEDESFNLIIADYTFEHIANPKDVANEFGRILKSGGWICARTPNKYSYISLATRLINNRYHKNILKYAQPGRKAVDVFPTVFKLNTKKDLDRHFPEEQFHNYTYHYEAEPSYYFGNKYLFLMMTTLNELVPSALSSSLFVFLKKKTK